MQAPQHGDADAVAAAATADVAVAAPRRRRISPVTVEEKRARQRAYVKKSYYRQLSTVNGLKGQVRQLEAEYERIVHAKAPPSRQVAPANSDGDNALLDAYARLTIQKEELRKENDVLQSVALAHAKFQRQMEIAMEAEKRDAGANPDPKAAAAPISIHQFTVEECQQIAMASYDEILQFMNADSFRDSTGAKMFGWCDERRVLDGGDRFIFSVKKFFRGKTAAELSLAGWVLNSTPKLRNFYAKSLRIDIHVVQQVDADNVVMYRELHSPDGRSVEKTLFLTTRFRIETGYMILFRSLDPEGRIVEPQPWSELEVTSFDDGPAPDTNQGKAGRWRSLFTWVVFDEVGENGEHCMFDFSGILPSNSGAWMLEILLVALRWENIVVGPMFALR